MIDENLNFDTTCPVVSVTELLRQFPHVPPRVLVTLAFVTLLERTVTPLRLCECGCGESVHGKARLASMACRQRVSRERRAMRAASGRQFNLVIQSEIPVPIPTVPVPLESRSEIFTPLPDPEQRHLEHLAALQNANYKNVRALAESWAKIAQEDFAAGRPFSITPEPRYKWVAEWAVQLAFAPTTRANHTSQPHEPATRARTFP